MKFSERSIKLKICFLLFLILFSINFSKISLGDEPYSFSFTITCDIRNYTEVREYPTVLKAINSTIGPGAFMIVVGDFSPPEKINDVLKEEFGSNYVWYPVLGNHELDSPKSVQWVNNNFKNLPNIVNLGPAGSKNTTYSFDYSDVHFVILDQYYNGSSNEPSDGFIDPLLLSWLDSDLDNTNKSWIFVFGHEPAYPQPDQFWGGVRHVGDSLDKYPENRDAFWDVLSFYNVSAFFCGHTHRYSRFLYDGVWQIDSAQARGAGPFDTFLEVKVSENFFSVSAFRSLNGAFLVTDNFNVKQLGDIQVVTPTASPTLTPSTSLPTPTAPPTASPTPSPTPTSTPEPERIPTEYLVVGGVGALIFAIIGIFFLTRK